MFESLFQPMHLLVILVVALLIFGPKNLPAIGKGLGEAIRGFKKALDGEEPRGQGRIDPIETFSHGQLVKRSIDSKGSGKLDALYLFKDGRLIRDERQYKVRCLTLRFVKIGFTFVA